MTLYVQDNLTAFPALGQQIACHLAFDPTCSNISTVLAGIATWLVAISVTLFMMMFLYGGLKYLTEAGNDAETTKAKHAMLYAVIGMVIVIGSWAAIKFMLGELL